jgi:hypothetical protein
MAGWQVLVCFGAMRFGVRVNVVRLSRVFWDGFVSFRCEIEEELQEKIGEVYLEFDQSSNSLRIA